MNHDEIHELLHAYADGELDLVSAREVEQHLRDCDECRHAEDQIRALHDALIGDAPAYRAPTHLRRNIRAALRREAKETTLSPWLVFATGAAVTLVVLALIFFQTTRTSRENAIVDQIVANHVRSLLATHLVDIGSSDQHTVKPWFDGKIDFAPDVHDFAMSGFPLVGGRLDYLDGKTVVALIYQRNKHPINVFISPATGSSDRASVSSTRRGYNIVSWTQREMNYWAISDLNETELRQFANLLAR
ncbi:MAG TPA: anti-sigma factor [Chthoniobacterales bacterium]|jgi:anti-sigma factor RsiW|nr:anti-sigma factor [Chthoniobacterales bacterium]